MRFLFARVMCSAVVVLVAASAVAGAQQVQTPAPPLTLTSDAFAVDGPSGSKQGLNQRGKPGYTPPCPPGGAPLPHHYVFELFAVDSTLQLTDNATPRDLWVGLDGHILGPFLSALCRGNS